MARPTHKIIQPVILIIIKEHDKVLLTLRHEKDPEDSQFNNIWQIPGGGLEFAETPEQCAVREGREELGIDIEVVQLLPKIYTVVRNNWQGILIPFRCKRTFSSSQIVLNEEATEYKWATLEEAKKLKLTPFTQMIIESVFE